MFMVETCIVKQILIMQIKQNKKKEMVDAFAELCYMDAQNFEVTGLIPIELPQETNGAITDEDDDTAGVEAMEVVVVEDNIGMQVSMSMLMRK
ncbi:hypothetical protein FRX31_014930 [Thalictrum thalictroides]|uniref:Uncharacterized protein n=1 Tax=Thalictrum thalictroides TaxID=46969 RepID=A0A7J6WEW6_THATH|nr:hypothetical protein FRX31_014930 [Thalictrum thalictroides]